MKQLNLYKISSRFIFLALCFLMTSMACYVVDSDNDVRNHDFEASAAFSSSIEIRNQKELHLEGINGNVNIKGVAGLTSVQIRGTRKVESESYDDAKHYLESLEIQVTDSDREIGVKTIQPNNTHGRNFTVTYYIEVPKDMIIFVTNVNGNVEVNYLQAELTVSLVNGNVQLRDINASAVVGITNGTVDADMILPGKGRHNIALVNGTIQLRIPRQTSAEFYASLTNGQVNISNLQIDNASITPKTIHGTLGSGNGTINLKTVNGNINVVGY